MEISLSDSVHLCSIDYELAFFMKMIMLVEELSFLDYAISYG